MDATPEATLPRVPAGRPVRRTLVIDPRLQYREAQTAAAITILSINLVVIVGTLTPGAAGITVRMSDTGHLVIGIVELAVLAAIWCLSLRRSHTVAGPVYAMARELAKLGDGALDVNIRLRPGDAFRHHAERINDATGQLHDRIRRIKDLADAMGGAQTPEETRAILQQLAAELGELKTRG